MTKHYVLVKDGRVRGVVGQGYEHHAPVHLERVEVTLEQINSIHGKNPFDGSIRVSKLVRG